MSEAKVFIDLKAGIIELEGPIDFVEKYMIRYAPPAASAAVEKPVRGPGRPPKLEQPAKKKKVSCDKIIGGMIKADFFSQDRAFGSIKAEVLNTDSGCSDNRIRKALKNAILGGKLVTRGAGRGMKYAASMFGNGPILKPSKEANSNPEQSSPLSSEAAAANSETAAEPPEAAKPSYRNINIETGLIQPKTATDWRAKMDAAMKARKARANAVKIETPTAPPDESMKSENSESKPSVESSPSPASSQQSAAPHKREAPFYDLEAPMSPDQKRVINSGNETTQSETAD